MAQKGTNLTIRRKARMFPFGTTGTNAPGFLVFSGPAEIAVARKKLSKEGDLYYTVRLDDPSIPVTIWANLVPGSRIRLPY